jgi:putative membrane protein
MKKNKHNLIVSVLIVIALSFYLFGGMRMGSYMFGTGMMHGWGGMGLGVGFFWILIMVGLFLLFFDQYYRRSYNDKDRAREIARERYARGEITEKEFEELMKKL